MISGYQKFLQRAYLLPKKPIGTKSGSVDKDSEIFKAFMMWSFNCEATIEILLDSEFRPELLSAMERSERPFQQRVDERRF